MKEEKQYWRFPVMQWGALLSITSLEANAYEFSRDFPYFLYGMYLCREVH